MAGFGDFLVGATIGGVSAVDEKIKAEEEMRRKMALAEYAEEMKRRYAKLARQDELDFESDPTTVKARSSIALNKKLADLEAELAVETSAPKKSLIKAQIENYTLKAQGEKSALLSVETSPEGEELHELGVKREIDKRGRISDADLEVAIKQMPKKTQAELEDSARRVNWVGNALKEDGIDWLDEDGELREDVKIGVMKFGYKGFSADVKAIREANAAKGGKGKTVYAYQFTAQQDALLANSPMTTIDVFNEVINDAKLIPNGNMRDELRGDLSRWMRLYTSKDKAANPAGAMRDMQERLRKYGSESENLVVLTRLADWVDDLEDNTSDMLQQLAMGNLAPLPSAEQRRQTALAYIYGKGNVAAYDVAAYEEAARQGMEALATGAATGSIKQPPPEGGLLDTNTMSPTGVQSGGDMEVQSLLGGGGAQQAQTSTQQQPEQTQANQGGDVVAEITAAMQQAWGKAKPEQLKALLDQLLSQVPPDQQEAVKQQVMAALNK